MRWLAAEISDPSETQQGLGGPIDSEYIQAQLIRALSYVEPKALRWLSQSNLKPPMASALTLALALAGDASQIDKLRVILLRNPDRERRGLAAMALGLLYATEAKPELEAALQDPVMIPTEPHIGNTPIEPYPVRLKAREALRNLAREDVKESARDRRARFDASIKDYRAYVAANGAFLKKLFELARTK